MDGAVWDDALRRAIVGEVFAGPDGEHVVPGPAPGPADGRHGEAVLRIVLEAAGAANDPTAVPLFHATALEGGRVVLRTLRALEWLIAQAPRVILLPFGIAYSGGVYAPLLRFARARGILVIAAIGNRGPGRVTVPGASPDVVSVGVSEADGCIAMYSGRQLGDKSGSCVYPLVTVDADAIAPYSAKGGTSLAAAWLTGHVLRILREVPDASAEHVRTALMATASLVVASSGPASRFGVARPALASRHLQHRAGTERPRDPECASPVRCVDDRLSALARWGRQPLPSLWRRASGHPSPTDPAGIAADSFGTRFAELAADDVLRLADDPDIEMLCLAEAGPLTLASLPL